MGGRILRTYPFKREILIRSTSMETAKRLDCDEPDLKYRGGHQVYLRAIDSHMQKELGEPTRWAGADTHDHTRKLIKWAMGP